MTAKEITNMFSAGQEVVCVSEDFPVITKYGGSSNPTKAKPKKGEKLTVDETLGDFLRFDKYDSETWNWWHHTRFRPVEYKFDWATIEETKKVSSIQEQ